MKYDQIKGLQDEKFRRLTGVNRSTFHKMVEILGNADQVTAKFSGKIGFYFTISFV